MTTETHDQGPEAITVDEFARRTGISSAHVRRMLAAGRINGRRISERRVVIPTTEIQRVLNDSPSY